MDDPRTAHDKLARELHEWFCQVTRQRIPLRMDILTQWIDWLLFGFTGADLKKVIEYLREEIRAGKRNMGAMSLRALLDIRNFEKDLGLANMAKSGFIADDRRIPPPPGAAPRPRPSKPTAEPQPQPERDPEEARRAADILAEFRRKQREDQ